MRRGAAIAILVVALVALPWAAGEFYVNLASQVLIAAIFASGLNLLVGYAGLTSLGHASYLGLSAYISAWMSLRLGVGHGISAPVALAATTLAGAAFGWVALRASGLGFLMITLALSQVLWGTAYRWASVTQGDNGLSGLTRPAPFGISLDGARPFYWFTLAVTALAIWLMARFVASPMGAVLAGHHRERDVVRRGQAAECLAQAPHLERRRHGRFSRRARRRRTPGTIPCGMKITIATNTNPSSMFQRSMWVEA